MKNTKSILEPDVTYHIYNRANGNESLFLNDNNYRFFLQRYEHYVSCLVETFCYCLMPNHFHLLVRAKSEKELRNVLMADERSVTLQGFETLEGLALQNAISKFLSQQFSHFFNGYAQAFNKQHGRKGNLFMHTFKRIRITDEKYLLKLIHYIHFNPVEAGLAQKPEDWKFSSYPAIVSSKSTLVRRQEVIGFFGDFENFIHCHRYPPDITGVNY